MDNKQENNKTRGPLARRDFLRVVGSVVAGGSVLATTIALARRAGAAEGSYYWQIDPAKCTQCGRCETDCVLNVSAVKCFHANRVRERIEHRRRELDVSDGRDTTSVRGGSLFRVHDRRELVQRVREMREGMRLVWQRIALSSDQARPLYGL